MSEKQKPAPAPNGWRGKPAKHRIDMEYGKMKEPTVPYRPNLLMRIGSRLFEKMTGKEQSMRGRD